MEVNTSPLLVRSRESQHGETINADQETLRRSNEFYQAVYTSKLRGPQYEGLSPIDFEKAIKDYNSVLLDINTDEGKILWPILTPIVNNTEYVPGFFERRYGGVDNVYYFSPPKYIDEENMPLLPLTVFDDSTLRKLENEGAVFIYEEPEIPEATGQTPVVTNSDYLRAIFGKMLVIEEDILIDPKNNTQDCVDHFAFKLAFEAGKPIEGNTLRQVYKDKVKSGELKEDETNGVLLFDFEKEKEADPEKLEKDIDRLWDIYQVQFTELIKNHPARQAQTRQEFEATLGDPRAFTVLKKDGGEIVSFCVFVSDITACDWLNPNYFSDKFGDQKVLYFPGIASDKEKRGARYSPELLELFGQVARDVSDEFIIVFQCTNISSGYIPFKIAKRAVDNSTYSRLEKIDKSASEPGIIKTAHYVYKAQKVISKTS